MAVLIMVCDLSINVIAFGQGGLLRVGNCPLLTQAAVALFIAFVVRREVRINVLPSNRRSTVEALLGEALSEAV